MTTPPVQPPVTLNPPDLRATHLKQVRTFRIGQGVAIAVLVFLGAVLGLVAWRAAGGGASGVAVGTLVFLAFLMILVIPMAISAVKERNLGGPASKGPSAFGQVVTSAPGPEVWNAVLRVFSADTLMSRPRATDAHTITFTRDMSMSSMGEVITVRIQSTQDGQGLVSVWSRAMFPFTALDYGRNRRFANAVLDAVPGAEPLT